MVYFVVTEDNELVQAFMHRDYAVKFVEQVSRPGRTMRIVNHRTSYTTK